MRALKILLLWCLSRFRRLAAGPYATAVLADTDNGSLLVPVEDARVGRRLCFNGRYDPELLDLLIQRCEVGASRVLFVGAHVGSLAIPVAKKVRRVVAVEADPMTFNLLRMNVSLNGLQNMDVHCFAAGDRNARVNFLSTRRHSGGNRIEQAEGSAPRSLLQKPKKLSLEMKRLDEAFADDSFDWIVMDVEGAEPLALRGMNQMLQRCRGLLTEVSERQVREVAGVGLDAVLSLVEPHFDEAFFLPEKPRKISDRRRYRKPEFAEMMRDCSSFRVANVMFWKTTNVS